MKSFFQLITFICIFQLNTLGQNDSLKGGKLYSSNFLIDGIQRDFIYYMPVNYGNIDAYPLFILLHDQGASGRILIKTYGDAIQTLADSSNAVVIYPDAVSGHWNDKLSESFSATDTVNDVGFISILIDYFKQVYSCDAKRVYVAGFFNGGRLAYRLACDISAKVTAVAPFISEDLANKCNSDKPVAIMNTNGLIDTTNKRLSHQTIEAMWKFFMSKAKE